MCTRLSRLRFTGLVIGSWLCSAEPSSPVAVTSSRKQEEFSCVFDDMDSWRRLRPEPSFTTSAAPAKYAEPPAPPATQFRVKTVLPYQERDILETVVTLESTPAPGTPRDSDRISAFSSTDRDCRPTWSGSVASRPVNRVASCDARRPDGGHRLRIDGRRECHLHAVRRHGSRKSRHESPGKVPGSCTLSLLGMRSRMVIRIGCRRRSGRVYLPAGGEECGSIIVVMY